MKLRGVSPPDIFAAEIQGRDWIEVAEINRQTEQLSRVTHTYDQFAQGLSELSKWRRQSWGITFWEHAGLVSSLQQLPENELRDNLRYELEGRREVTAEWLARACELIQNGLCDIQADAGRVAARRSERISFEIEPQTSAEQIEGFRRLNVQRQQVEQILADKVEPALPRDHMIGLIDAGGNFVLGNVIEQAMTELFGQAIDLGASGGLITLVRLGFKLIEPKPVQPSRSDGLK